MTEMDLSKLPAKRQLPKLMACMTRASRENMRIKHIENVELLDAKGVRRKKLPLHECIILELKESGLTDASDYLRDLIEDNIELVNADELGIVVDLRNRPDYLEHLDAHLRRAVHEHQKGDIKKEALLFMDEARYYSENEKGILWLAEKLYLAGMAITKGYLTDGGRLNGCCCYHYAKFLLDKFPGADPSDSYNLLIKVRNSCVGKPWLLWEPDQPSNDPQELLVHAACIQLHRVLLMESRAMRSTNPNKAETLARLAERRAQDADDYRRMSEAILEIGICQLVINNLNNAQKSFERAYTMFMKANDVEGMCESCMHLAAVMQRKGEYEIAVKVLINMGTLAIENMLTRQLGRALHFLGELFLRQDRPELGTIHLHEAFWCFAGMISQLNVPIEKVTKQPVRDLNRDDKDKKKSNYKSTMDIYNSNQKLSEIFPEEAEQSRLMMGVSQGQEYMASYFGIIREAKVCSVATIKVIEWKFSKVGWWVNRKHQDFLPCLCPLHKRTPLDVLWLQIKAAEEKDENAVIDPSVIKSVDLRQDRDISYENFTSLRSLGPSIDMDDETLQRMSKSARLLQSKLFSKANL